MLTERVSLLKSGSCTKVSNGNHLLISGNLEISGARLELTHRVYF